MKKSYRDIMQKFTRSIRVWRAVTFPGDLDLTNARRQFVILRPRSHDAGTKWNCNKIITVRPCVHTIPVGKKHETVMLTVMIWNRNETVPLPASCERLTVIISSRFHETFFAAKTYRLNEARKREFTNKKIKMKLAKLIGGSTGDSFVFVQCVTF